MWKELVIKVTCRKCHQTYTFTTYKEYLENRFCKKCGAWLSLGQVNRPSYSDNRKYEEQVSKQIDELCRNVDLYLDYFEKSCPFGLEQLRLHLQTVNLRYKLGSVSAAVTNDKFIRSLWKTLIAWGLNARGARLLSLEEFREVLLKNKDKISAWEDKRIDETNLAVEDVAEGLWELINHVRVSRAYNPIVSGSKTFHHLLPELVPPIDREYTRPFFKFWSQYFQNEPRSVFIYIWKKFAFIANKVDLRQYIRRTDWNTTITKVIDNAIIGYCKYHKIPKLR